MNLYLSEPLQLYELKRQQYHDLIARAAAERFARTVVAEETCQRSPLAMLWQILRSAAGNDQQAARWRDQPTMVAPQS